MFPNEFLLYALEQSRDGIAFINMDGRIDYVNPAWTSMHGYTEHELLGQSASIFYEEMRQGEQWAAVVENIQSTNFHEVEMDHRKKDGSLFRVWITANMLRHQDGTPVGYLVNSRDITERRLLEETLREANQLLRQQADDLAARNADLDAFSHSVAHDLKNLLASVLGYSEMLIDDYAELAVEEQQGYLARIHEQGTVMHRVIDNLLLLARLRRSEVDLQPMQMQPAIDNAVNRLTEVINKTKAQIQMPTTWPKVLGYAPWVEEVWENYLSNALKYGGSPPHIELGWAEIETEAETEAEIETDTGAEAGAKTGNIRFWVKDNGPGIPEIDQQRLFIPFSRLNEAKSKGHGLGLSIVQRIVEKCGGCVGVDSSPGKGSTFWFELSAVQKEDGELPIHHPQRSSEEWAQAALER